jgi:hypothetical protein
MASLRALALSALILSAVAACAAPIPEQIAGEPGVTVTADAN